jgi:hypothetical protein
MKPLGDRRLSHGLAAFGKERQLAGERLPMRKIRDVPRLKAAGLSQGEIPASVGIGATSAGEFLRRATAAGLTRPLPHDLDDTTLDARLFPPPPSGPDLKDWGLWCLEIGLSVSGTRAGKLHSVDSPESASESAASNFLRAASFSASWSPGS